MIYEPQGRAGEYAELAANLYRGCPHGCLYCYAPAATRTSRTAFAEVRPRKDALGQLERDAKRLRFDSREVLLSFTCDPYPPLDDELQLTRRAIGILHAHGLAVNVLSKAGLRCTRDFDLLAESPRSRFGTSLTLRSKEASRVWEPGAAPPAERLAALQRARKLGIRTWASLEPVIDPQQTLSIIWEAAPWVDVFRIGKLNHHPHASRIDWPEFRRRAAELCERLGVHYALKADLKEATLTRVAPAAPERRP